MRLVALGELVAFVCLSIIFGIFVITRSVMIVLPSSLGEFRLATDVLRVILALALAYGWFRFWKAITDWYFWRYVGPVKRDQDDP